MNPSSSVVRHLPGGLSHELSALAFAPLRRSDQRRKAEQYVQGLLEVQGRKSMRRIAALHGDKALEQSLQHFVSCSTWSWTDMRVPLAQYVERALPPSAWVVRPLVIPKAGSHSVGVARRLLPDFSQPVNCQEAYGVWLARPEAALPVHWELQLPPEWLDSPGRRQGAGIPDSVRPRSPLHTAVDLLREMAEGWQLSRRPVVLDCGREATAAAAGLLAAARLPYITRISSRAEIITPADTALSGYHRRRVSARHVMDAARRMRRPVEWIDPASGLLRTSLVAKVPVLLDTPGSAGRPAQQVTLVGEWEHPYGRLSHAWLTDLSDAPVDALLRLTKLTRRVDRDLAHTADAVGLRDFEGRTYPGWHRHTTLASLAHCVAVLSDVRPARDVGGPLPRTAITLPRTPGTLPPPALTVAGRRTG